MEKKTGPKTLMMWYDPEFPELCPVRHILAWIGMSGIKSGAIFPSVEFLTNNIIGNKDFNGHVPKDKNDLSKDSSISYITYLNFVKSVCNKVIERKRKWGAHVGRKTGYLFGVWGGGADIDLMNAARHKSLKNAAKYKKDASLLLELAKANDAEMVNRTPKWKSLYSDASQLAVPINAINRPNYKPIHELASIFLQEKLELEKINRYDLES